MILGGMGPGGGLTNDGAKIFAAATRCTPVSFFIGVAGVLVAPVAHRILHRPHARD